eukprot:4051088-Pyramimonas_sp.AAC.1
MVNSQYAAVAESVAFEWASRGGECVCEWCSRRAFAAQAQASMLNFHSTAMRLAAERERLSQVRYRTAAPTRKH